MAAYLGERVFFFKELFILFSQTHDINLRRKWQNKNRRGRIAPGLGGFS
jgi:hypothetical protein